MKKKILIIIISAVLLVAACAAAIVAFGTPKLAKKVDVFGCELNIPENWASDSKGNIYNQKGKEAGKITLIDEDINEKNVLEFYDGETKDAKSPEKISETLTKYTFTGEKGETILYFTTQNENSAYLVFYKETVSERLADKIAKTFKAPEKDQVKENSSPAVTAPDTKGEENRDEQPQETPAPDESEGKDGDVVYSGTVVISSGTLVTHPDTGEQVAVGPYAEARGFGAYLDKPISCVIKRSGSGYIATASCGGSVIASYPLNSEAELNWAIGMIKAYS